tara:strand:- start:113 stop:1027 length:915 start_codon:yes stop_codon:yes gene_type:complete
MKKGKVPQKLIVLGTSHVNDIHGSYKEINTHPDYVRGHYAETNSEKWTQHLENTLNKREDETWTVENCGLGGHGISTYHHRIMNCLEKDPDIDLTFLIEIPCSNRLTAIYEDVIYDVKPIPPSKFKKKRLSYKFFNTFLKKDWFHGHGNRFYNNAIPINMDIRDKDFWKIMSEKFKAREMKLSPSFKEDYIGFQNVMNSLNRVVPEEEILLQCMSIHGYLTNLGYNVCWFNFDYEPLPVVLKNKRVKEFLKVIPYKNSLSSDLLAKQFNKGNRIRFNKSLCFDGVHSSKEIWYWLVENYFVKLI